MKIDDDIPGWTSYKLHLPVIKESMGAWCPPAPPRTRLSGWLGFLLGLAVGLIVWGALALVMFKGGLL